MIRNCKNCAGKVVFDVRKQKLCCESCGSFFEVSDYTVDADFKEEIYPDDSDTMERSLYICKACGAQITLGKNEASTFCVYCGNPTIVFSRIAKLKKPEMIIPFKVSKETALSLVKQRIGKGFFIPKEIKNFKIDALRGIYIPYHICNVECDASAVLSGRHKRGKSSVTYYYLRSMWASMPWITTDASRTLSDSSSQRLEPFDMCDAVTFDEDYLLSFYSDIADVSAKESIDVAKKRAAGIMRDEMLKSISGTNRKIVRSREDYEVYEEPVTAMLPAWFITFRYENVPYTILVNGQTGKVVGGVPWDKKRFGIMLVTLGAIISFPLVIVLSTYFRGVTAAAAGDMFSFFIMVAIFAFSLFAGGIGYVKKVLKAIGRTSASTLNHFSNTRKGDNL